MNVRLLRRVAKHIAEEPRRFIMGGIHQQKVDDYDQVYESEYVSGKDHWKFPKCGTAACIAGWSAILAGKRTGWHSGRKALGITPKQGERLFAATRWPEPFQEKFMSGKTPAARVKAAVARIEHFIKTKGAE